MGPLSANAIPSLSPTNLLIYYYYSSNEVKLQQSPDVA